MKMLMKMKTEDTLPIPDMKDKKILVIEDDHARFMFIQEMLLCVEVCIIRALSYREALELISAKQEYNLVIIDTGIADNENCKAIRRLKSAWPDLPVLAIAGRECKGRVYNYCELSCDTMMCNNFGMDEFIETVTGLFYPVG
jgi:DNA-binding response OmpR family regulator